MRRTTAVLLAVLVLGGAAACGTGGDEPPSLAEQQSSVSPSPSASPDGAEQLEQETVAEAEQVLAEYRALEFEVQQAGFGGWPELARYWGPELADGLSTFYRDLAEQGAHTEGTAELVSSEVTEYVGEPAGYEEVELTTCLNTTELRLIGEAGAQVDPPTETAEQYVNVYRLEHQGPDAPWLVTESTAYLEREC